MFTFLAFDVITLLDFHRCRHTLRYIQTLLSVLTISSRVYFVFAIFSFESTHLSDNTEMSKLTQCLSLTPETRALLPSENLPVSELLELCLPTLSSSMPSMEPGPCFSNHPPTENIVIYLS
jgi:hypothetical protein